MNEFDFSLEIGWRMAELWSLDVYQRPAGQILQKFRILSQYTNMWMRYLGLSADLNLPLQVRVDWEIASELGGVALPMRQQRSNPMHFSWARAHSSTGFTLSNRESYIWIWAFDFSRSCCDECQNSMWWRTINWWNGFDSTKYSYRVRHVPMYRWPPLTMDAITIM